MGLYFPNLNDIRKAANRIDEVVVRSSLQRNDYYSEKYKANVLFKREDLQQVRSYKIRGAFNKICSLKKEELRNGVVAASAGNHAQGVAVSCFKLKAKGYIFMPSPTPKQKIEQVNMFGRGYVEVRLIGDSFDDALAEAKLFAEKNKLVFVHAFDDKKIIEGQGTIGFEILEQSKDPIDFLFLPIGGGGLAAGVSSVFSQLSKKTKIIGVEPSGAPSMQTSIQNQSTVELDNIDMFVDGAAVKQVGKLNFSICKATLHDVTTVSEGKICQTLLELYNKQAIVVEPAGALTTAVLDDYKEDIKSKTVVCLISGSNNDITRTAEIRERAMLHAGLKHYFIIRFPQRAGALREFLNEVLGPQDDITHFEYSKKHNRNSGPAVVGIEIPHSDEIDRLKKSMIEKNFFGEYLNESPNLFQFLV